MTHVTMEGRVVELVSHEDPLAPDGAYAGSWADRLTPASAHAARALAV
jgi:hypothetical protein